MQESWHMKFTVLSFKATEISNEFYVDPQLQQFKVEFKWVEKKSKIEIITL
jgi:hypothetical protein